MKKKAQAVAHTEQDELNMMSNPGLWPRWPWLPMKRRKVGDLPDTGLLHADAEAGKPTKLYKGNLYEGLGWFPRHDQAFWKEYPNFDAIVADGWVVD